MAGGSKEMIDTPGPGQAAFLALDGTQIYVTDYRPGFGSIATRNVLYSETDTVAGLAVKDGIVYWALQGAAQIKAGPTAGATTASVLIDALNARPMGVAVDEDNVYWVEDGLRVRRAPKRGGATPVALYETAQPFGDSDIAVDATAVYWTEHGLGPTGVIRRLAK